MTKTVSISLETLLAAKERRAVRQQEWLARHGVTLVSLTLVMPRPVKDSEGYRQVMGEAIKSFALLCQARGGGRCWSSRHAGWQGGQKGCRRSPKMRCP
ncbi:hypothetical protein PEC301879_01870 [Pectobacterium carotovorum subsp. carotovorum]|nr:hypothetical protein PEC301879_01870 [Pectobacterium carotovorum subsp. carotovorum]